MYPSNHISIYSYIHLYIYSSICLSIYQFIHISIYPSIHLSMYTSIHLSIYPSKHLSNDTYSHISIYISIHLFDYQISTYLSIFYLIGSTRTRIINLHATVLVGPERRHNHRNLAKPNLSATGSVQLL